MRKITKRSKNKRSSHGTQEWSVKTVNCCSGCSHNCKYCYARSMAVRFKQLIEEQWPNERVRPKDVNRGRRKKYDGPLMFPSSHDITPANVDAGITVLKKLVAVGNQVLVVSKPHLECIEKICASMEAYKDHIKFRFTIGARDDRILSYWEPNAPCYEERKKCLIYAYECGFQTSVSVEPMLDSRDIDALIEELSPYVTDAIWVGKMNHLGRLKKNADPHLLWAIEILNKCQSDEIIRKIYQRHKNNPLIKWKKEIKKVVGIPLAKKNGLDI